MIQLGKEQTLEVLRTTSIGAYLGEERDPLAIFARSTTTNQSSITDKTDILLPKNEFTKAPAVGDKIRCFVYLDSEDRPVATLKKPSLTLGSITMLRVVQVNKVGAFLDWGLVKDLFLPYKEQTYKVSEGDRVLVTLYVDKSKRLCATMKLYKYLRQDSDYQKGDKVPCTVYELNDKIGAYVAVDKCFSGLIPKRDLVHEVKVGDELELRISRVLDDGKLELSMRDTAPIQLGNDCDVILKALANAEQGFLPTGDKTDSDVIRRMYGMSKISFKRAIGHLMKQGKIKIEPDGIMLVRSQK